MWLGVMNNDINITSKKVLNYQEIYESIHVTLTLSIIVSISITI